MRRTLSEKEREDAGIMSAKEYARLSKLPVCNLSIQPAAVFSVFIQACSRGCDFWMGQARSEIEEGAKSQGRMAIWHATMYADSLCRLIHSTNLSADIVNREEELEKLTQFYREIQILERKLKK